MRSGSGSGGNPLKKNAKWYAGIRMGPFDTSIGGSGRAFPETGGDRPSLETLCARYWKPVYAYLRGAYAKSNEEAKDLTQAFFLRLLEDGRLDRFDPSRGRFRTWLKVLLRSFLGHEREALGALKRGGGVALIPMDEIPAELPAADPEQAFDRLWRVELAERTLAPLRDRADVRARIYEAYALVPKEERPTYAELAARFGIGADDVRNHLFAAREELRGRLREELAATGADAEAEWNELFGSRREA
jgi:RNA polymerase sigma factor (sigma-70 family)